MFAANIVHHDTVVVGLFEPHDAMVMGLVNHVIKEEIYYEWMNEWMNNHIFSFCHRVYTGGLSLVVSFLIFN